ncbi:MAG: hypothetical protein GDA41_03120 [Rhodospirillales bacterium]|nr:hypothetical protein [Rhodospirillales bacterium]
MNRPTKRQDEEKPGFFKRLLGLRRGPWEAVAAVLIALGVIMLTQSFSLWLYSWSFTFILVGTGMFVIVSHFRE